MITVVSQPGTYNGVKNTIKYVLQTDNYLTTTGTKARLEIAVTPTPANNNWIELVIAGQTIRFTAKTSPDNSGTQVQLNPTALSITQYLQQKLIPDLQKNIAFADYDFTVMSPGEVFAYLKIEAKNFGAAYNITYAASSGSFYATSSAFAGTDNVYKDNFRIYADLFLQEVYDSAGSYRRIGANLEGVPDSNNQCTFDVSEYLKPYLQYPVPAAAAALIFVPANVLCSFYIKHAEAFGDPAIAQAYNATIGVLAFNGGKAFRNITTDYANYFSITTKKFLTQMTSGTEVVKAQHQYLSFYLDGTSSTTSKLLKTLVKLYYTDGTSSADLEAYSSSFFAKRIITAKVGYTQLNIDSIKAAGKTVAYYDVRIYNATDTIAATETFRFKVSQKQSLSTRLFLFFNAFGQPETMLFTGNQSRTIALDNDVVRRTGTNQTGNTYSGEFDEINNELRANYSMSTGYKPKTYLGYFKDFLLSENRYEQVGDNYYKMVMAAQKIALDNDQDTNFSIDFNYADAWIERGNA